jgi:hypothetical protein
MSGGQILFDRIEISDMVVQKETSPQQRAKLRYGHKLQPFGICNRDRRFQRNVDIQSGSCHL